jgi:hypothetical protein
MVQGGDHFAYFGDGNAAQVIDFKEYIKRSTGIRYVKFIFIPSQLIEQQYDIGEKQDKNTRAIIMEYPATDCIFLQRGTARTRVWIFTDFIGGLTPASRRTDELTTTLKDTERLYRSAEAAKNRAYEELERERQQQLLAIRTKIDMLREVARGRGRIDSEGDDISVDQPE